jgi:hypothetical protein
MRRLPFRVTCLRSVAWAEKRETCFVPPETLPIAFGDLRQPRGIQVVSEIGDLHSSSHSVSPSTANVLEVRYGGIMRQ